MTVSILKPPKNTRRVSRWADLPDCREPAEYLVTDQSGNTRSIWVSKHKRQILEALMRAPMFCASICRLSHFIMGLREVQGLNIETERFSNDPATGRETYGIYKLLDNVTPVGGQGVRS